MSEESSEICDNNTEHRLHCKLKSMTKIIISCGNIIAIIIYCNAKL